MRVFMLASGDYMSLAELTAKAFTWCTRLPVELLDGAHELKMQVPCGEQYMMLDADQVFLRHWRVPEVPLGTFAAAKVQFPSVDDEAIAREFSVSRHGFLNTGLFIADPSHEPVFAQARELFPRGFSSKDEAPINIALQQRATPIQLLERVNSQKGYKPGCYSVHPCMMRGGARKLAEAKRLWWYHGDKRLRKHLGIGPQPRVVK